MWLECIAVRPAESAVPSLPEKAGLELSTKQLLISVSVSPADPQTGNKCSTVLSICCSVWHGSKADEWAADLTQAASSVLLQLAIRRHQQGAS